MATTIVEQLDTRIRAFVFDAYGTLFDVHSAVSIYAAAIGPDAVAFSNVWRAKQLEYCWIYALIGSYVDFWTLTQRALDHALACHPAVDPGLRAPLLEAYRTLAAFPEAAAVLTRLRAAGYRTAILSNGEPGMLADAARSSGLDALLDAVISVETAQTYKTRPETYALAGQALGLAPEQIAFVSSNRWDVAGAAAFGFTTIWVNRTGAPPEYPGLDPIATVSDLNAVG